VKVITYTAEIADEVYPLIEKHIECASWANYAYEEYAFDNPSDRLLTMLALYSVAVEVVRDPLDSEQLWHKGWHKYVEKCLELELEKSKGCYRGSQ